MNYASAADIREVTNFYNLSEKSFETDFRNKGSSPTSFLCKLVCKFIILWLNSRSVNYDYSDMANKQVITEKCNILGADYSVALDIP